MHSTLWKCKKVTFPILNLSFISIKNICLVTFIGRDVLETISNDIILVHFQEMNDRQFSL
jgi:hypothetical protein